MPKTRAEDHNEFLSLKDAAALIPCSVRTIRRRIAEGQLPAYRTGRIMRVKRGDLEALMQPVNPWAVK